jgi:hypothetical protein
MAMLEDSRAPAWARTADLAAGTCECRSRRWCASRGRGGQSAPATYLLVGINCAVFLAMVARGVSIGSSHD